MLGLNKGALCKRSLFIVYIVMKHIKNFDAFYEVNADLYESNNTDETVSLTIYESIKDRAFGSFIKKEDCMLEHAVDDSFLQDVSDLAQVNENGDIEHFDKKFTEMLESFNAYYSLSLPAPKNPRAIFESLEEWYDENDELLTPESFEQKFTIAVFEEELAESGQDSSVAQDEAKVDAIVQKKPGTLTPEEFVILSKSRIRARGQASTKDRYQKLQDRYVAEFEAHKANGQTEAPRTVGEPGPDAFDNHVNYGVSANAGRD